MRLTCPNCDAQYEVDDAVIPPGGRDVQCSNCGHTWFQPAAGDPPQPAPEPPAAEDPAPEPDPEPQPAPEAAEPEPTRPAPERRRALDDSVLGVLREEAEREARARRGEPLESQPDLGLEAGTAAPPPPQDDTAPSIDDDLMDERPGPASRRELLPDIEEINSTLGATSRRISGERDPQPSAARETASPNAPAPRKSSFGRGFGLVILVVALFLALYLYAPAISAMAPALKPVLVSYVEAVNGARAALAEALSPVIARMNEGG